MGDIGKTGSHGRLPREGAVGDIDGQLRGGQTVKSRGWLHKNSPYLKIVVKQMKIDRGTYALHAATIIN